MMWKRLFALLVAPLLLTGCLLTPGKFTSTLTIHADRSFAFTYQGEVIALDPSQEMAKGFADKADPAAADAAKARAAAGAEAKNRAIAEALGKEEGYRSVRYLGGGKFAVDYAIAGKLDHGFAYPFNIDAEGIFPFVAVELRKDGSARVMAPGFANDKTKAAGMEGSSDLGQSDQMDGSFTLATDAEIVMQNSEDGVKGAGAAKTVTWRATPLTKQAPTAVVRFR